MDSSNALVNISNDACLSSGVADPEKAKKLALAEQKRKEREAQQKAFEEEQRKYMESLKNDPVPEASPAAATTADAAPSKPWKKKSPTKKSPAKATKSPQKSAAKSPDKPWLKKKSKPKSPAPNSSAAPEASPSKDAKASAKVAKAEAQRLAFEEEQRKYMESLKAGGDAVISEDATEDPLAAIPLPQRLTSKKFKERKSGLDELAEVLQKADSGSPVFDEYRGLLTTMVKDSNAIGLGLSIDCIGIFADKSSIPADDIPILAKFITEKGLKLRRTEKVQFTLLKLMECNVPDPVVEHLAKNFSNRVKKVPPLCADCLTEAFVQFGMGAMKTSFEVIKDKIPVLFKSSDAATRQAGVNLCAEIQRWVPGILTKPLEKDLREAQLKEVADATAARQDGSPLVPTVYLRSDREKMSAASKSGEAPAAAAFDPSELVKEIDLTKALRKTDYSTLKKSKKWNERKGSFDLIVDLCGPHPKISNNDGVEDVFDHVRDVLNREKVVQIRISACRVCETFSKALKKNFSSKARIVVPILLSQFKEKSKPLEEQIYHSVMWFMEHSTSLDTHLNHVDNVLKEKKFPQIREKALELACRIISNDAIASSLSQEAANVFLTGFGNATDETTPTFRALGVKGFKLMLQKFGAESSPLHKRIMKALAAVQASHPRVHKSIVGAASTSGKSGAATGSSTAGKKQGGGRARTSGSSSAKRKENAGATGRKASAPAASAASAQAAIAPASLLGAEEATQGMVSLGIDNWEEHAAAFSDSAWQPKVQAYAAIEAYVVANKDAMESVDVIFSFVAANSRCFKDSNFNLAKASLSVVRALAAVPKFTAGHAVCVIESIAGKFGDRKVHEDVVATFDSFCEHLTGGVGIVMTHIPGAMTKVRSPVALGACFEYMTTIIERYGAINVDCKGVLNFLNGSGPSAGLKSSNRNVAPKARAVLAAIFHQLGPKFHNFVKSQITDAAVMKLLDTDFEKIGYDADKAKSFKPATASAGVASNDLDIPRADIVSMLPDKINKRLSDTTTKTAWQTRSKALEDVAKALEDANHCIVLNKHSADLLRVLNDRCVESNVNVKKVALTTTKSFLASIEAGKRSKVSRIIVEGLMSSFADKKEAIRESAVDAMKAFVTDSEENTLNTSCFLGCFKSITAVLNMPAFRGTTLGWLKFCLDSPDIRALNTQLVPLVTPLIACLCDRTSSVRSAAEAILGTIYASAPRKTETAIKRVVQDLKPAEQRAVQSAITNIKESASAAPAPTKKAAAKKSGGTKPSHGKENGTQRAPANKRLPAPGSRQVPAGKVIRGSAATTTDEEDTRILVASSTRDRNKREKKYLKTKWIWDISSAPREDFIAALRVDFEHYFNVGVGPTVVNLLFSKRDADHCEGIAKLSSCVRDFPRELMSVTDLVLKWVTYRMCLRDNTKAIQAMQTFLQRFLQMLINHSYELADFEAHSLLPFLTDKVGHRSDRFRTSYRNIMAQMRQLHPVAKMAPFFIEALHSKNAKTRSECLEELGIMVHESNNWKICGRKGIQFIAKKCGSSDAATRNAAIGVVYHVWKHFKYDWADLKKVVGELTPKILSLMKEKFRTLKASDKGLRKSSSNKIIATPNTIRGGGAGRKAAEAAAADEAESVSGPGGDDFGDLFTLDVVTLSPARSNTKVEATTPAPPELSTKSLSFTAEKSRVLQPSSMLEVALDHVRQLVPVYGTVEQDGRIEVADPSTHSRSVTAIKAIVDLVQVALGEPCEREDTLSFDQQNVVDVLNQHQSEIVEVLLSCVEGAASSPGVLDFRVLSLILSVLMKLVSIKTFAEQSTTLQVQHWLSLMVQLLTSPKLDSRNTSDDALCRAVNYLTTKFVAEAPLHTSICASYSLLAKQPASATTTSHSILLKLLEKIFKKEESRDGDAYDNVDLCALFNDLKQATPSDYTNSIARDVARTICRNVLTARSEAVHSVVDTLDPSNVIVQTVNELVKEMQSSVKDISDEDYESQVSEIVQQMLKPDVAVSEQSAAVAQLHQLTVDFPDHSMSTALQKTSATAPFRSFIIGELASFAESEGAKASHVVHQGSVSLQSRLTKMQRKFQLRGQNAREESTSPPIADLSSASKENGVFDGNLEKRQKKAAKMMHETRDSLNKMRARLQKLKVGATPAKTKTEVSSSTTAAVPTEPSTNNKAMSSLRDRLKMWQAKHSS